MNERKGIPFMKQLSLVLVALFALVSAAHAESVVPGPFGPVYKDAASGKSLPVYYSPVAGAEFKPTAQTTTGVVATTGTASHTYTNSDDTKAVYISAISIFGLGKVRADIQTNVSGSYVTYLITGASSSSPGKSLDLSADPIRLPAGKAIKIILNNLDSSSLDLSSSVHGSLK